MSGLLSNAIVLSITSFYSLCCYNLVSSLVLTSVQTYEKTLILFILLNSNNTTLLKWYPKDSIPIFMHAYKLNSRMPLNWNWIFKKLKSVIVFFWNMLLRTMSLLCLYNLPVNLGAFWRTSEWSSELLEELLIDH